MNFIDSYKFREYLRINPAHMPNPGTLRFYGDWFGRPMDNCHVPKEFYFENGIKFILFEDGYLASICDAKNIELTQTMFSVKEARVVKYEYGHYGIEKESRKRFIEYIHEENAIFKSSGLMKSDIINKRKIFNHGNNSFEIIGY